MKALSLTEGNVKSALLRFTLPFLAASLLQFLYGAADIMIVGQFADAAGISAVSTGSGVMQTVTGLIMGLATGGTVLIGQYIGAKRPEDVKKTIGTMFVFFTLFAAVVTVVMALATNLIISSMQVPVQAVLPARQYLFICSCGIVFITGYNMISAILRGMGDSKRPMIFVAISCILNVGGDLLLVGVFDMGAAGAAIATVAAQAVSLVLSVLVLRAKDFPFDFKRASFRVHGDKLGSLVKLGIPVALQNVLVNVSFLLITAIVNHLGLVESAAVGTADRVTTFAMMVPISFMSAISAITAQNMGAGQPKRAKQAMGYGILFSLIFGLAFFAVIQLFPAQAVRLFSKDPQVIYHGARYLRSFSLDCVMVCFVFCLNGFFGGCGRTGFTMANSLISTFAVRVPVVFLVSLMPEVTLFHIGMAAPLASMLQIVIQLIYLKSGRWRQGSLVDNGALPVGG